MEELGSGVWFGGGRRGAQRGGVEGRGFCEGGVERIVGTLVILRNFISARVYIYLTNVSKTP